MGRRTATTARCGHDMCLNFVSARFYNTASFALLISGNTSQRFLPSRWPATMLSSLTMVLVPPPKPAPVLALRQSQSPLVLLRLQHADSELSSSCTAPTYSGRLCNQACVLTSTIAQGMLARESGRPSAEAMARRIRTTAR
jgi:hypothetical protein